MTASAPSVHREPTIVACATAPGGSVALLRLSGPDAWAVASRSGLPVPEPGRLLDTAWPLPGGRCPCRIWCGRAPATATGHDLVEITLPGSRDLVELGLDALLEHGAEPAGPGAFARQAVATGRLRLDQAEALLGIALAADAEAAAQAVARLRSAIAHDLATVRTDLIALRVAVEAGLDFIEEGDVRSFQPAALQAACGALRLRLAPWWRAGDATSAEPRVCLVGAANAGKSSLFNRLLATYGSTSLPALVSAQAGTTRDWVRATITSGGRSVELIDCAGYLPNVAPEGGEPDALDAAAVAAGSALPAGAGLIIACSAWDAVLPDGLDLPPTRTLIVATKTDLAPLGSQGTVDARAVLAVSALTGDGIERLARIIDLRLQQVAAGSDRQQRLLTDAIGILARLEERLPADELLAEDLRRAADALGDLIGATTPDHLLDAIFARFCIGK
jgi:tRNA modification GTPase